MNPHDFLRKKLEHLANMFPTSKYQYEFDQFANFHIIQVWPVSLYNNDDSYKITENSISNEFDSLFFPGTVIFVSEDSLNQVSNAQYEVKGNMFGIDLRVKETPPRFTYTNDIYAFVLSDYSLAA